ncbi:MAG: hypothetical protein ABJO67_05245 [Pseudoruegeria sp.]
MSNFPQAGQVFEYHYLWNREAKKGQTEGRKKRPSCMAIVIENAKGQHVLFIAAITTKSPIGDTIAIEIPETEAHRAKLTTDVPLWVVVSELNSDILEQSYVLEDRTVRGQFGASFTKSVGRKIQECREAGKLNISART